MREYDWPDEPDLDRLAGDIPGASPPLSSEALGRIERRMRGEVDRLQRGQTRRRFAFGLSLAATVLAAIGGYAMFRGDPTTPAPDHPDLVKRIQVSGPAVDERIVIAVSPAAPTPTEKPLVRLDEYRSLFAD